MQALHHFCFIGAVALAATQLSCQASSVKSASLQNGKVSVAVEQKLQQLAESAGYELVDYNVCSETLDSCVQMVVKTWDGEALVYELTKSHCRQPEETCIGGFKVRNLFGVSSVAPGMLYAGLPDKPVNDNTMENLENRAQLKATAYIMKALSDGQYDEDYNQFWNDLESIKTLGKAKFDVASVASQTPVSDRISFKGAYKSNPAVLVSGRMEDITGRVKRCGQWESRTSRTTSIDLSDNFVSNVIADGCDAETAVFARNGGSQLINPQADWSKYRDNLVVSLPPVITIPTVVWVVQPSTHFTQEKNKLEAEFGFGNEVLNQSRCGVRMSPVTIQDRSKIELTVNSSMDCTNIDSLVKRVGYNAQKMNVYIVNELEEGVGAGIACKAESENVIIVRSTNRDQHTILQEFGHWMDLEHTSRTRTPQVNRDNVMHADGGQRNMFTAGQCYRMSFSSSSYINKRGLRYGPTKNCKNSQNSDQHCPGLKNEF